MGLSTHDGDHFFAGNVSCRTLAIPSSTVVDDDVSASAAIQASKMAHQHQQMYTQLHGTAATTAREVIHIAKGSTGSIVNFRAGVVVACVGAATISIRLKKNGSNIDTAALVLDSTNAAFAIEAAAGFSSSSYVTGDVFEVDITATAGGGTLGQGLFCELTVREDAS